MDQDEQKEIDKLFINLSINLDRILNFYSKEFTKESIIQYIFYYLTMTLLEFGHSQKYIKKLFNDPMQMGFLDFKNTKQHEKEKL